MKTEIHEVRLFRCFGVSSNMNAFGLYGVMLMAKNGEAYEAAKHEPPVKGSDVVLPLDESGEINWARAGYEIPRRLTPDAPKAVVKQVFA